MRVDRLTLRQFRNYLEESLDFNPNLNILVGNNAQGKTNIVEALYFLALGRSHRTHLDSELIQWGKEWASLSASVCSETGRVDLKARLQLGKRKSFQVSGNELHSLSELYGHFNVVLFSPDDLQLVKGSPSLRRQFLDVVLAQVSPVYRSYLVNYNRILQQRNSSLKLIAERRSPLDILDAWEPQLVELGSRIIAARYEAVRALNHHAAAVHLEMTGHLESLSLIYCPFYLPKDSYNPVEGVSNSGEIPAYEEIYREFTAELERKRDDEIRRGVTLVGPQRDDLLFGINGIDARTFGSQGQQRTVVLSCKLGEAQYMRSQTGEYPVLLLDDVMSELDTSRRHFFLNAIRARIQIILTTTSLHSFTEDMLQNATVFSVASGKVCLAKVSGTGGEPRAPETA